MAEHPLGPWFFGRCLLSSSASAVKHFFNCMVTAFRGITVPGQGNGSADAGAYNGFSGRLPPLLYRQKIARDQGGSPRSRAEAFSGRQWPAELVWALSCAWIFSNSACVMRSGWAPYFNSSADGTRITSLVSWGFCTVELVGGATGGALGGMIASNSTSKINVELGGMR